MQSEIKVGQRFNFNILSDNPSQERQAVVTLIERRDSGRRWTSILHTGWRLTNFQKPRVRQRWCLSVELTGTYTSTDAWSPSLCWRDLPFKNIDFLSPLSLLHTSNPFVQHFVVAHRRGDLQQDDCQKCGDRHLKDGPCPLFDYVMRRTNHACRSCGILMGREQA